jgi:hypothetical protein
LRDREDQNRVHGKRPSSQRECTLRALFLAGGLPWLDFSRDGSGGAHLPKVSAPIAAQALASRKLRTGKVAAASQLTATL